MADTDEQELRQWASSGGNPDPYYHGKGYRRLVENEEAPPEYTPAPQTLPPAPPQPRQTNFSNNSSNVVVVSQPLSAQPETVVVERTRPNDNLVLTLVMMVLCCITLNFTAFLCLIPALILSLSAGCASNSGDYDAAQSYAKVSCCCSLCSLAVYIMAFVVGLVILALFLTVGLGFIGIEAQANW